MKIVIDSPVVCSKCGKEVDARIKDELVRVKQCENCGPYQDLIDRFCMQCIHRYSSQNCCNALKQIEYIHNAFKECVGKYYKKRTVEEYDGDAGT